MYFLTNVGINHNYSGNKRFCQLSFYCIVFFCLFSFVDMLFTIILHSFYRSFTQLNQQSGTENGYDAFGIIC